MKYSKLRILYAGDLMPGFTCAQRAHALRDLGCRVEGVDTVAGVPGESSLARRIRQRVFGPFDSSGANHQILTRMRSAQYDLLWLDKALTIEAKTLREVRRLQPGCRIVGFSLDYMTARHNDSPQFRHHLPLYDIFFTTKSYGVSELLAAGCPRVES